MVTGAEAGPTWILGDELMLELVRRLAAAARGLAVVATNRSDGTIQASLVNAGLIDHPVNGRPVVAFVARPAAVKLRHLRRTPRATVTFQAGSEWVTVEGQTELVGPDDSLAGVNLAELPALLRTVYRAAGGSHDDWPTFDRVMAEERRLIVLVACDRVYSNPGS
jgi:PPOX class probable F420-dependent enzyme